MSAFSNSHLQTIDSLRACAALSVLSYHLVGEWRTKFPEWYAGFHWGVELFWQLDFGKIGVLIFFLVSGYLVPFTTKDRGINSALVFLVRRMVRLLPMFVVSLLLGILVLNALGEQVTAKDILLNTILLPNFFESSFILGIYWTLQIELFFYFIIFFVMFRTNFRESPNLAVAILLVLLFFAEALRPLVGPSASKIGELVKVLGFSAFIFFGVLIRLFAEGVRTKPLTLVLTLYTLHEFLYRGAKLMKTSEEGQIMYSSVAGAIAILVFIFVVRLNRVPKIISWLGKISYSLYLTHGMLLWVMVYLIQTFNYEVSGASNFIAFSILYVFLSIAIAAILYYGVEEPINSRRPKYS